MQDNYLLIIAEQASKLIEYEKIIDSLNLQILEHTDMIQILESNIAEYKRSKNNQQLLIQEQLIQIVQLKGKLAKNEMVLVMK